MTTVGLFDTLTVEAMQPPGGGASADGEVSGSARPPAVSAAHGQAPPPGRVRAVQAHEGRELILLLSSDSPGMPVDESNLVVRAAETFARSIARRDVGESQSVAAARSAKTGGEPGGEAGWEAGALRRARAALEKRIPLGAGLGGGSSDAARTLVGLNALWRAHSDIGRLAELAGGLGSDVPFFLFGPSSVCTGRGEIIRPVPSPSRAQWVVLILPNIHMPTAAVYRRFDELGLGFDESFEHEPDWRQWSTLDAKQLLVGLVNDLERPAFEIRPDLATLRAGIELQLARTVRMSGSGSSLFTLFDDRDEAHAAAKDISDRFATRAVAAEVSPVVTDDLNT